MTQLATTITPTALLQNTPVAVDWQGYNACTSRADARAAFYRKYERTPDEVRVTGGAVLAGPIAEGQVNSLYRE